jgi:uncharacterized delta-60 repeat protein
MRWNERAAAGLRRIAIRSILLSTVAVSGLLGVPGVVLAAGEFDPAFGTAGLTVDQFSSAPTPYSIGADVVVAPDGKIVVAGQVNDAAGNPAIGVARYLPDGQLDTAFGAGGAVVLQVGQGPTPVSNPFYSDLAVMPDERIVIAGTATDSAGHPAAAIVRLTPAGALDPTFAGGEVVQQLGESVTPESELYGLALEPSGKLVVTGFASDAQGKHEFIAERVGVNGEPDGSFGVGGLFRRQLGGGSSEPESLGTDVLELSEGDYVFCAKASDSATSNAFALAKLTSSGQLDLGFGS